MYDEIFTNSKKNKQYGTEDLEAIEEKERKESFVISDHKWSFKHNYLSKYCLLSKKSTESIEPVFTSTKEK